MSHDRGERAGKEGRGRVGDGSETSEMEVEGGPGPGREPWSFLRLIGEALGPSPAWPEAPFVLGGRWAEDSAFWSLPG